MQLIPEDILNQEKKTFTWSIPKFDEEGLEFDITFDNPEYISIEYNDRMKITFRNTEYWLKSKDAGKKVIPSGYEIDFILPPQSESGLSSEQVE